MSNHSHHNIQERLDKGLKQLRDAGHKSTKARKALLKHLLSQHGPFSAEDLQQQITVPCDLATVYRNLSLLESLGMVVPCEFGDGTTRYEWAGTDEDHHHHVICRQCHRVEQLDNCVVEELETAVKKRGFTAVSHRLEFYGVCTDCHP